MAYIHLDAIAHPHPHLPLSTRTILGYIHLDAAGKPCGRGWISAGYNCSPDKRAYTKQYRQADRDKAAQAIREERRAAKGYKKEVKSVDDFVKNVNVLQDEISSKLANLEYDYDQSDPQPKNKKNKPGEKEARFLDPNAEDISLEDLEMSDRALDQSMRGMGFSDREIKKMQNEADRQARIEMGESKEARFSDLSESKSKQKKKPKDTEDWGKIKLSDIEKQAEEGQVRMYKKAGMSEENAKKQASENMQRMRDEIDKEGQERMSDKGTWHEQMSGRDLANTANKWSDKEFENFIRNADESALAKLSQGQEDLEKEEKAKKQLQQQIEKRRKAAERQAKAADKKISQLDKQMQRGQTGRKKLSVNDELKLAENKFKAQSDRQAALENIIQATLAAQQSQQVGGKSNIAPFSGQSIRDRRALERSLRDELNKLSDLSSEADAANQIFEMNRKLKEESAGMKDVINRSNELVRKSRIEKLKRMWNMDSLIEAAAANKTAFEQRFPTRQISIPANTSLVGYLNALSGMARGDSATIKEYSVVGSSYHADSASDVTFTDGCYRIKNTQDKFIRI